MKTQFNKKEIQELKKSNQNLKQIKKEHYKSRHKIEQNHLYFKEETPEQPPIINSRRKKT